jgi:hypothetical protein
MSEEHELKPLRDFAIVPAIHEKLARLVQIAEFEDWNYKNAPTTFNRPILYNYVQRTFTRVHEQKSLSHWTRSMLVGTPASHRSSRAALCCSIRIEREDKRDSNLGFELRFSRIGDF